MELKLKNFEGAREILTDATAEPSAEVKRRVAAGGNEPVQMKLHKSVRLWTLYADLEEGMGTLESTRKDIWVTYLSKFVKRYGKTKMERARELFQHAVQTAPADYLKPLYLQYAKLEEDHGLAKRAMEVYDKAIKALPAKEKLQMYDIYITRATEFYDAPKTREIYEQAIESELNLEKTVDILKSVGDPEDEMDKLERRFTAAQENSTQSGVTRTPFGGRKVVADQDTIELPEGDDDEDVNEVEIARRDIPAALFGDLARAAENIRKRENDGNLGALERIKRQKTVRSLRSCVEMEQSCFTR
ncbi:hypothetical protein MKW92_028050 [Papaver armeniacum]|nr:hypothetical protein MKW92_028050 [Papaver armeniacum]